MLCFSLTVLIPERYLSPTNRFEWIFKFSSLKKELDKQLKISHDFTEKVKRFSFTIKEAHFNYTSNFMQVINERREYLKSLKNTENSEKGGIRNNKNIAFLDLLLNAQDEGEKYMTQKDIRDQVSTFMFEVCYNSN